MNELEKEISLATVQNLYIESNDDLKRISLILRGVKGLQKKVKESFDPIIEKAHAAHKEAVAQRKKYLDPLLSVEEKIKASVLEFDARMKEIAAKAEREANERLAKQADEAKQKLMDKSAKTNDAWEAEVLKEQAVAIKPIEVKLESAFQKQEGMSIRKTWVGRVVDISLVPTDYLLINQSLINEVARKENGTFTIPGVVFEEVESVSMRS